MKGIFWCVRAVFSISAFWFFFWALPYEMIRWNKPQPDLINLVLMIVCCWLATIPDFTKTNSIPKQTIKTYDKTKKQKDEELLQQILEANPTERKELLKKLQNSS